MTDYASQMYIAAMIIFTIMLADFESKRDDFYIRRRLRINHSIGFIRRTSWLIIALFIMKQPISHAIPLAALFSLAFNFLLNLRRGKSKWYISQSNWYDNFFIWIASSPWYIWIRNLFPQRFYYTGQILLTHAAKMKIRTEAFIFSLLFWNPVKVITWFIQKIF